MEHATVPIAGLSHYYRNARRGNIKAIAESLRANGQYKPIVVNKGTKTGRPEEVLVGNHTLQAAISEGWETIDVVIVDVDDDQARRIVLADNRTSDLGAYDDELLLELLMESDDLDGTAFTAEDVEALEHLTYSHDDGPRDLDALHDDVGDPTEQDGWVKVELLLPPELAERFTERLGKDQAGALAALLDAEGEA